MIEKIKEGFISETLDELNSLEVDLSTEVIANESDIVIEKVFTAVHKIKGTAPMLGIDGLNMIAHSMEQVYGALRDGNISLTHEIVFNTIKLIPALKAELSINSVNNLDSEDVSKSIRYFDSLIS